MSICLSNKDDCSWHMPRCGHMFHDKCIQTWKASCKSEPSYEVCPQCRKPFRKFLSFYKQRGRSHARILRPSSSHKLDIILIPLELPESIYCETVIQLCVRRFHSYPPHLFTFYLTHAHFVFFNVRSAISPRLQFYKRNRP